MYLNKKIISFFIIFFITFFAFSSYAQDINLLNLLLKFRVNHFKSNNQQNISLEWKTDLPENQNLDSKLLNQIPDYVKNDFDNKVTSVLIVKNGYLVYENYFNQTNKNTLHMQFSVTKSILSSLVGIYMKENPNFLEENVLSNFKSENIKNVNSNKKNIQIKHLLNMTSGLKWDEFTKNSKLGMPTDIYHMVFDDKPINYILSKDCINQPGKIFNYNTGNSQILSEILEKKIKMNLGNYAFKKIFQPIGVKNFEWIAYKNGSTFGGHGLKLSSRDMAKFGYLYLNKGLFWNNSQIIPENWVLNSTVSKSKFKSNPSYGYGFWVYKDSSFKAEGLNGQRIFVDPTNNMVVVFTSKESSYENLDFIYENFIKKSIKQ